MLFTSQSRSVLGKTVPSVFCTARAIYIIYICILFLFPCLYVRSILIALFLSSKTQLLLIQYCFYPKSLLAVKKYIKASYSKNVWIKMETYLMRHNNRKQLQKIPPAFYIERLQTKEDQEPNFPTGKRAILRCLREKKNMSFISAGTLCLSYQ